MQAESIKQRVSSIELYFDLVFVFTITQLTRLVEHAAGPLDFVRALLILSMIWWMYDGFSWLTTDSEPSARIRIVLILAMTAFMVIALSIPEVFGAHGLAFGIAYLFVTLLHFVGFVIKGGIKIIPAMFGVLPWNLGAAVCAILAGVIHTEWNWLFYLLAALLFICCTYLQREKEFSINSAHFVERHGLIVIIALGESIVAIGTGASQRTLDVRDVAVVVLSIVLIATFWWSYFYDENEEAEQVMLNATPERRCRYALVGYWYTHLAMIFGIILAAAGVREVVADDTAYATTSTWLLAAGTATYFAGDVIFRHFLNLKHAHTRAIWSGIALLSGLCAVFWNGLIEMVALVALGTAILFSEQKLSTHQ